MTTVPPIEENHLPTRVPIMPVQTAIDFDILPGPTPVVGMRIQTPDGVKIVLLSPDMAKEIGEQMRNAGVRAGLGLVVPSVRVP